MLFPGWSRRRSLSNLLRVFHFFSPFTLVLILLHITSLCEGVPAGSGVSIDWNPNSKWFNNGAARVTLRHGEGLELNCSNIDRVTFYLVSEEEMNNCERDMSSADIGTCGGGGSKSIRKVMKTMSAGANDLLWPVGTYYIIAMPAGPTQYPIDFYCRRLNLKLVLNVVSRDSAVPLGEITTDVLYPAHSQTVPSPPSVRWQALAAQDNQPIRQPVQPISPEKLAYGAHPFPHLPASLPYYAPAYNQPRQLNDAYGSTPDRLYQEEQMPIFSRGGHVQRVRIPRPSSDGNAWSPVRNIEYQRRSYENSSVSISLFLAVQLIVLHLLM